MEDHEEPHSEEILQEVAQIVADADAARHGEDAHARRVERRKAREQRGEVRERREPDQDDVLSVETHAKAKAQGMRICWPGAVKYDWRVLSGIVLLGRIF